MNTTFFRTILWLLVLSLFVIILQHTIFSLKFFDNIKPELFTLIVLHYSFYESDKTKGYFLASFVGFIEDVLTNQIFGINIFIKSLIFLFVFITKEKLFFKTLFSKTFLAVIINIFEIFLIFTISKIFSLSFINPFNKNFLHYIILYIIVTPIFLFLFDKIKPAYMESNES